MRSFLIVLFSFLMSVLLPVSLAAAAKEPDTLLIRGAYVISADAQISRKPANVLLEQGRIKAIGSQEYPATKTLDAQGQYLIPGLIDTHVHLDGVPGFTPSNDTESAIYQQALAQIPRSYLYFGFTSLLDLASTPEAINQWNSQPLAPQADFCAPVPIPGGYPIARMPEDMQAKVVRHLLHDHHQHAHETAPANRSPQQIIEAISAGDAICVKIFYEKGFGPMRNLPVPSEGIIRELIAEARNHYLPVYLHGNSASAYEFGLATGVDMIVHGLWHRENLTEAQLDALANQLAKAGTAVQPTLQVLFGEQDLFDTGFFNQTQSKAAIPASLLAWYQSDAGQWMTNMIGEELGAENVRAEERYLRAQKAYAPILENVMNFSRKLQAHKAPLVFGSDTPSGPIYTQFPGINGYREIQRWYQLGIGLPDIFRALTVNNARLLGAEKDLGSVETGKLANLLLLKKNPLTDISAYDSIQWVILKGQPVARDRLASVNVAHSASSQSASNAPE